MLFQYLGGVCFSRFFKKIRIKFYDHAKDNHLNDNETYTKIDGTCDIKVMDKIKRPEAAPQRCSYKKVF